MSLKISRAWTKTERSIVIGRFERKLRNPRTPDEIKDIQERIYMLKHASAFLLNAKAETVLKGRNVERVEAREK